MTIKASQIRPVLLRSLKSRKKSITAPSYTVDMSKPAQLIAYQQQKFSVKKPSVAVSPSAKLSSKLRSPAQAVRKSRSINTAPVRGGVTICGGPGWGGSDRGAGFVQNGSLGSRGNNEFSGGVPPEDGDAGKTGERDRVSYGPSRESFRGGRNGGLVNGNAGERFEPGRPQVRVYGRRSGIGRGFDVKRDGAGHDNWGAATDDFVARVLVKTCLKGGKTLTKKGTLLGPDTGRRAMFGRQ